MSVKGFLKECQFCNALFEKDETILGRLTSMLWNLYVSNYQMSFGTFIFDVLVLINTRSKSADPKKREMKFHGYGPYHMYPNFLIFGDFYRWSKTPNPEKWQIELKKGPLIYV